jgi:glycosyltransferase involved in cell wall biosynthesis
MIDNNSTDRSAEIVKRYPRVKLVNEKQKGDFAARNRGIRVATGEIIAFTDSDTSPFNDWLQNIAKAMLNPDVSIIVGNLNYSSDSTLLSMIADYEFERAIYTFSGNIKEIYFGYTCNMVVRKTLFDSLGLFPAIYRNSDIVFLRQAVDRYSCSAVRYCSDVRVRRLEVSNIWAYYSKQNTYGRDFQRYNQFAACRPLNTSERLQIFKNAIKKRKYSFAKSAFLLALLFMGALSYEFGRLKAVFKIRQ